MITPFDKKEDCCGCTACKSICPENAITMKPDEEGFLYPLINMELCVNCHKCKKVCTLQNEVVVPDRFALPMVYAARHKSISIRMSSTSGGAYTAISDYILNSSGIIYGAEFDKDFIVRHTGTTNAVGRDKFKGSKYVQSDLGEVFIQIKEDLKNSKAVLFTGTACQVSGLRSYLEQINSSGGNINMDNLILNDIICHGTPSPLLWTDYLQFIQKKNKLKSYSFRFKERGWRGYNVRAEFENGICKIKTADVMIYANIFSSDLALRPSCYHCKFSNLHRPSDIMIGDFWGIEKSFPELDDNKGVSLLFINTPKGKVIFDEIKNDMNFEQSNIVDCLQHNLQYPTKLPMNRKQFWADYRKYGFEYVAKKYANYSLKGRARRVLKAVLIKTRMFDMIRKVLLK